MSHRVGVAYPGVGVYTGNIDGVLPSVTGESVKTQPSFLDKSLFDPPLYLYIGVSPALYLKLNANVYKFPLILILPYYFT